MAGPRRKPSPLPAGRVSSCAATSPEKRTSAPRWRRRGIRVTVVCPGGIDTPMKRQNIIDGALARGLSPVEALASHTLGDPDGVARILAFLASEDADYLLGTIFTR